MNFQNAEGPHKVVLGTYSTHTAAQHAVDVMAGHKFPVEHVTIVGTGLKLEERVLGRWTMGKALATGASTGAWIGLLIGLAFWIVSPWTAGALITPIVLGIIFGAIFSAAAYFVQRRAFVSSPTVAADRYDILVDSEYADEGRRLLTAALTTTEDGTHH